MFCGGARPAPRIVHCLNYQLWTGGVTDHMILEASGATVVPFGVGNTRKLHRDDHRARRDGIHCTPSYPALIEKMLREEMGREPRSWACGSACSAARPGSTTGLPRPAGGDLGVRGAQRQFRAVGGDVDPGQPVRAHSDLHFHAGRRACSSSCSIPASGGRLPIAEGDAGELVCTHLDKRMPAAGPLPDARRGHRDRHGAVRVRPDGLALPRHRPHRRHVQCARRKRVSGRGAARDGGRGGSLVGPFPHRARRPRAL